MKPRGYLNNCFQSSIFAICFQSSTVQSTFMIFKESTSWKYKSLAILQAELKNHSSIIEETLDIAQEISRKSGLRDSKKRSSPV